jgi:hypothetical protein
LLLVLAQNPSLRLAELGAVVDATLAPAAIQEEPFADPADALPEGRDRDGHDAKLGYGLLDARRACLAAADPISAGLTAMGEDDAARAFVDARRSDPGVRAVYSTALGRWAVRALLADPGAAGTLRVILRHLRLLAHHEERRSAHGEGALVRQVALLLRRLARAGLPTTASVRGELLRLSRRVESVGEEPSGTAALERAMVEVAARCFAG